MVPGSAEADSGPKRQSDRGSLQRGQTAGHCNLDWRGTRALARARPWLSPLFPKKYYPRDTRWLHVAGERGGDSVQCLCTQEASQGLRQRARVALRAWHLPRPPLYEER